MVMGEAMAEPAPPLPVTRRRRLVRLIVQVLVAASVVAVALDLMRRFDAAEVSLTATWLAASILPASAAVLVQVVAWRSLMRRLCGVALRWDDTLRVYLDAQMARYTPGKVGLLAVRVAAAPRLGVSGRLMVTALLIELLSWAGVGILLGLTCMMLAWPALPTEVTWAPRGLDLRFAAAALALAALAGLSVVCALPRRRYPAFAQRLFALAGVEPAATAGNEPLVPLALPLWHLLHWGAWVLAGSTLCLGLGASWAAAVFAGGVLCLAIVLGFLAIVAPAGAGVREVVISVGAAPVLGPSSALVLGLTARVVSLAADVLCWALVRALPPLAARRR